MSILDCGCGSAYTSALIIRLCEILRTPGSYAIHCMDHIDKIICNAESMMSIFY